MAPQIYNILLQAMMGIPILFPFIWCFVLVIVYILLSLDAPKDGTELTVDERLKRKKKRIKVAAIAATIICVLLLCLIAFAPGPAIN